MSDFMRPHRWQPTRLPSLGFSRQEHWSGLPFPSPVLESEVTQSCPTLSDPMDCSPPGSSIHGIFQARVLEWGAIAFSNKLSNLPIRRQPYLFFFGPHHTACGILVPPPGIEPTSSALGAQSFNHWTIREVPEAICF